jgi:rhamnulose-1-phosphate aldolase/alcohol dehydrogenase
MVTNGFLLIFGHDISTKFPPMQTLTASRFKYVSYQWDEAQAQRLLSDQIALLIYRSNLLGADLRITNFGGGNTSCKTIENDPLTGEEKQVMWVKGSGGDIGTLTRKGLAGLYVDRMHALKNRYRGLKFEDEMVGLLYHCLYDLESKAPSIDTPLHAFLPYKHIDHLHPDALIALAAAKDGERIVEDLFDGEIAWIPWQRPGFDLGLQLEACIHKHPGVRGIVLGAHGLFTWGETSYESYVSSLEVIEKASAYLQENYGKSKPVFGGAKLEGKDPVNRQKASAVAPTLRGLCSSHKQMVGHFSDDDRVLEFVNSKDLERLAFLGTSCPDHFLRTKIRPLVLKVPETLSLENAAEVKKAFEPQFESYRRDYKKYYDDHKHPDSPPIRDPNPVVILWPGVGMFTFARDKATARVSAEFYINAINVMKGAEAISTYASLPLQEAFNIEYWQLEEDKLKRMPPDKPLSGRIALITGSAGGIGKAIAEKFIAEGACVVLCDNDESRLNQAEQDFQKRFKKDQYTSTLLDVTDSSSIKQAIGNINLAFGGVDIIVNNAGISISRGFTEYTEEEWDKLNDILVKGQFLVSQAGVRIMKAQGLGGDIVNIASKNGIVSGPKNAAYGSAKAAQLHMTRLMAAELGDDKIRVNAVNPDAIITDSKIWQSGWAKDRAMAYGVAEEQLPEFYAGRTLLKEVLYPSDVANTVFIFVSGMLNKSTGNMLNVDGGFPASFPR